jgi:4-amino-4-deoxy-L-arabinose transferase-like glycosyltransferase
LTALSARSTALWMCFAIGLLVRLAVLSQTGTLGAKIVDEQQYTQIAENIRAGNGFAWGPGQPTSIRPPLYPGLLAATWTLTGGTNFQAVRILQFLLSLATAALVYWLGATLWNEQAGGLAAAITWLYPSFIFYDALILTETLFTFLLVAFLAATVALIKKPGAVVAIACGVTLGLAALTRSVLWPLPLVLCPALLLMLDAPLIRRLSLSAVVLVAYVLVIGPWAVRNTRLQHVVTVVDTMGGMNLRMGNYEYTPDDRMWDAVSLRGEKNWVHGISNDLTGEVTEGQKEKWAQRKAIEYMRSHPRETLRRSLIKFADLWGLEREFIAGVQQGLYSPPLWFAVVASGAILVAYALLAITGALGIWMAAPRDKRAHSILLLPVLVLIAAHTIVFGHSRYHLPLMPLFAVYAGALLTQLSAGVAWRRVIAIPGLATAMILVAVWLRQMVVVDLPRITGLLSRFR